MFILCKVSSISCKEQVDGSVCGKDHNRMVCQSGVSYHTSLSIKTGVLGTSQVSTVDENVATIPYLQKLKIEFNGK